MDPTPSYAANSLTPSELSAYAAIGQAVLACQSLEMLFALCVRLVYKQGAAVALSDITPLEKNFSKQPTKALLQELRRYIDVNAEFEAKLADTIDRRHLLIHRWGIEHDLPSGEVAHLKIGAFARQLASDAVGLSTILHKYLAEWLARFPEVQESLRSSSALSPLTVPESLRQVTIERLGRV